MIRTSSVNEECLIDDVDKITRKIFPPLKTKSKIICLVSQWEQSTLDNYTDPLHNRYIQEEKSIFRKIRYLILDFNYLSFTIFNKYYSKDYRKPKERNTENDIFLKEMIDSVSTEKEIKATKIEKNNKAISEIEILPNIKKSKGMIDATFKETPVITRKDVGVLCIDYSKFNFSILKLYTNYINKRTRNIKINETNPNKLILYNFFKKYYSSSLRLTTGILLNNLIYRINNNTFTTEDEDTIEFLSNYHTQYIQLPQFWPQVEKDGFLCDNNYHTIENLKTNKKGEINFFYSFEALLFYELKNLLINLKRCKNCKRRLPTNQRGVYCKKGNKGYKKCHTERNKKRQRIKFYKDKLRNLTKT